MLSEPGDARGGTEYDRPDRSQLSEKKLGDTGYIQKLSQRRGGGSNAYRLNIVEAEENFPKDGKILPKGRKKSSDDTKKEKEKETGEFTNERHRRIKHGTSFWETTTPSGRDRGEFQRRLAEMLGPRGDGWTMLQAAPQVLLTELEESYLRREVTLEESRDSLLRQIAANDGPQGANGTGS